MFENIALNLLVIIFVKSFRVCSIRLIGRVELRSPLKLLRLGIRFRVIQRLKRAKSAVIHEFPECFIIS